MSPKKCKTFGYCHKCKQPRWRRGFLMKYEYVPRYWLCEDCEIIYEDEIERKL